MDFNLNTASRILVVGDLMIDHYINGQCSRISPEAPVQVVEVSKDDYTLGGAGNVLKNLKALGCRASLMSVVGDDDQASIVEQLITDAGAGLGGVIKDPQRCTTIKSRVLVGGHQLIRLDREVTTPITEDIANSVLEQLEQQLVNFDLVLVSDYNKGFLSDYFLSKLFKICREAGVKTLLDPKGNNYGKYYRANLIKPNKKEAIIASGININSEETLHQACVKIKDITGCDDVIVTMSEEGIAMYTNNNLQIIPTKALGVIDVTGAGDTVLASLGLALASGLKLYDACNFANHAAAVVVSKVGSATATLEEIKLRA